jgi:hypothetical protein
LNHESVQMITRRYYLWQTAKQGARTVFTRTDTSHRFHCDHNGTGESGRSRFDMLGQETVHIDMNCLLTERIKLGCFSCLNAVTLKTALPRDLADCSEFELDAAIPEQKRIRHGTLFNCTVGNKTDFAQRLPSYTDT